MKNLFIILIFSLSVNAQNVYLSLGFDVRNSLVGSNATKQNPAIDATVQFGMIGCNTEVIVGYERFQKICFDKFWFGIGHHFNLSDNLIIMPTIEPSLIGRWGSEWQTTSSHLSIGGSVTFRYKLSYHVSVELQSNALPRTDLYTRYPELYSRVPIVYSNYFKILYRI